jgi:ribosome-associated toxin RatA of RatAB toxin-antitoxin module
MKTIKHQIEVACCQEKLFDLTQDYSRRLEWDPYLTEAYLCDGAERADVGIDSYCKNHFGSVMVSRYISFNRPSVAAVTMIKGPLILKRFSGAWNVKKLSEARSLLVFTYSFELKGGFIGRLFLPIAAHVFSKDMQNRLLAIKHYLESEIV